MAHPLSSHNGSVLGHTKIRAEMPEYKELMVEVVEYWRSGLSQRSIATKIGITPGQVAGIIHRERKRRGDLWVPSKFMRMVPKEKPAKPKKEASQKPHTLVDGKIVHRIAAMREAPPAPKQPRIRLRLVEADTEVTFAQLMHHHCRWPLGEVGRPDFRFCGKTRHSEGPYCVEHSAVAKQKVAKPEPVPHDRTRKQPKFNYKVRR